MGKDSHLGLEGADDSGRRPATRRRWCDAMSYFSDTTDLCWFLKPDFAKEVLRLHRIVGNAVTDGRQIIVGVGSTQLIHAVFHGGPTAYQCRLCCAILLVL